MFKNPFSFEGRIRRIEYGLSVIILYTVAFIIGIFIGLANLGDGIMYLFLLPVYWFGLAQGAKRCHDRGNSGWYQIIPFYGLWMLFADSDNGTNEYGFNPKGVDLDISSKEITYVGISDDNIMKLGELIKNQKKGIFSTGKNSDIWDLLQKMISSKETALMLIDQYHSFFNKDIISELKSITNNYEGIKNNLSSFIEYNVVASEYPHELLK